MGTKVSVIIPVYNVEEYLVRCLDSVTRQTFSNLEIICVNDGSTDESLNVIRRYAQNDRRFVVIDQPNGGYGQAVNRGIDAASGKYISIIEADDFAEPNMLKILFRKAEEYDLDVARCHYYRYRTNRKRETRSTSQGIPKECVFTPFEVPKMFFVVPSVWAALYKKSFLNENEIRFLETPGAAYQDTSFTFKVNTCAQRFLLIDDVLLHYRIDNPKASTKSRDKIFAVCGEYEESRRFIEKFPDRKPRLLQLLNRAKYNTYRWNLRRIPSEAKKAFLERMTEELRTAQAAGEVDLRLWGPSDRVGWWLVLHWPKIFLLKTWVRYLFLGTGRQ